jgi:hypothetical protein
LLAGQRRQTPPPRPRPNAAAKKGKIYSTLLKDLVSGEQPANRRESSDAATGRR